MSVPYYALKAFELAIKLGFKKEYEDAAYESDIVANLFSVQIHGADLVRYINLKPHLTCNQLRDWSEDVFYNVNRSNLIKAILDSETEFKNDIINFIENLSVKEVLK